MNLTSDANATVVKGMGGAIRTAVHMVYAKSKLPNATADSYVCSTEDCVGRNYKADSDKYGYGTPQKEFWRQGWISATKKGYPISNWTGKAGMVVSIVGAIDYGGLTWEELVNVDKTDDKNTSDWIVLGGADYDGKDGTIPGVTFVPKARLQQQGPIIRSLRQRASARPTAASFTSRDMPQITILRILRINTSHRL